MIKTQLQITVCPNCGSDKIRKVKRDWIDQIQEQAYIVPNLEFYECPTCGEKLYDREAMRTIEAYSPLFRKKQVKTLKRESTPTPTTEVIPA